jgi:hypothetical protein
MSDVPALTQVVASQTSMPSSIATGSLSSGGSFVYALLL